MSSSREILEANKKFWEEQIIPAMVRMMLEPTIRRYFEWEEEKYLHQEWE